MDDDGLNMRNWGYYEPSFKEHLGLQLMSPMVDHRDTQSLLSSRENPIMVNPNPNPNTAPYHNPRNSVISETPLPIHYMRDSWLQRDRLLHMLSTNPNFSTIPNTSSSQSIHTIHPLNSSKEIHLEEDNTAAVATSKPPRAKKPKKLPSSSQRSKSVKRNIDMVINGIDMDISGIPIPICSCTGVPQQCYRWGCGGWQSACCTTTISMYPLPMSTKRRGTRIAGRKMSQGAFKKVLEKLASESYNFANTIDLRGHWAKHGTNKFVTIR